MATQISSPLWTPCAKCFPPVLLALFALGGLSMLAKGQMHSLIFFGVAAFQAWWIHRFSSHIVAVSADARGLHLSGWRHQEFVPWSSVANIRPVAWVRGRPYAINFREPTGFGPRVFLIPPVWSRRTVVEQLRAYCLVEEPCC